MAAVAGAGTDGDDAAVASRHAAAAGESAAGAAARDGSAASQTAAQRPAPPRTAQEKLAGTAAGMRCTTNRIVALSKRGFRSLLAAARKSHSSITSRQLCKLYKKEGVHIKVMRGPVPARVQSGGDDAHFTALRIRTRGDEVKSHDQMRRHLDDACTLLGIVIRFDAWPSDMELVETNAADGEAPVAGKPDGTMFSAHLARMPRHDRKRIYAIMEFKTDATGGDPASWRQALGEVLLLAQRNDRAGAVLLLTDMFGIAAVLEYIPAGGGESHATIAIHVPGAPAAADPAPTDCADEAQLTDFITTVRNLFTLSGAAAFATQLAFALETLDACFIRCAARWDAATAAAAWGPVAAGAASSSV